MKDSGRKFFQEKFPDHRCSCFEWITSTGNCEVRNSDHRFQIGPFGLEKKVSSGNQPTPFHFGAPTVSKNTLKILRALQVDNKAVLLEGLPGVGKSSLVDALARMTGNSLVRINLSDQTEISDLFGADLPTESGTSIASFSWHDGPFLSALKAGHWILLDELNLATQSVLEGLNACLDHRGTIFIPELNRSFEVSQKRTRIFGCQNPPREGGDRKNLPKSFLNRFVKVYLDEFEPADLVLICRHQFPTLSDDVVTKLVNFSVELHRKVSVEKNWGYSGSPWQFNLRDLLRWCQAASAEPQLALRYADLIFVERFRMPCDRDAARRCLKDIVENVDATVADSFFIDKNSLQIGSAVLRRSNKSLPSLQNYRLINTQFEALESLMLCVKNNWLSIVVGRNGSGKSSLVSILSDLVGHPLHAVTLTSASDTSELLGGFEQTGPSEKLSVLAHQLVDQVSQDLETFTEPRILTRLIHIQIRLSKIHDDNLDLADLESIVGDYDDVIRCAGVEDCANWKSRLASVSSNGRISFEWMDSVLVRAIKNGEWLLLDDANLCNSSVLDRLNGLLETNGVLVVGERGCSEDGKVPTVVPHPDFRLFLTMNPQHGELSPAIRNRGVEIFVDGSVQVGNEVDDLCLVKDLSAYSSTTLLLRQNKLLQELVQVKGMHPSIEAKTLLAFSTPDDLQIREAVFSGQFKLRDQELFQNLLTLLNRIPSFNAVDHRCSVLVSAFVEAVFGAELIIQKSNLSNFSLAVKQLWTLLVSFAAKFFGLVKTKILNFENVTADDAISLAVISNLFQAMKSRLDSAGSDKVIMKQWSLGWLRLQNVLSGMDRDFELAGIESEIGSSVRPYFSAFNLSVRDFWRRLGLPTHPSASLQVLEERKLFCEMSLQLGLTNKTDLASVCDHIGKLSKSLSKNSIESLAAILEKLPLQEKLECEPAVAQTDILKLQFNLLSAWNAHIKNAAVALKIGQRFGTSHLFSLESIELIRNANISSWTREDNFDFKLLSVQQLIVIKHVFKVLIQAKRDAELLKEGGNCEADKKKRNEDVASLTQLMLEVAEDKKDFLDVEISTIVERKRQLAAIQTQLVADCREVVQYEASEQKARLEACLENFSTILRGIDSLEAPATEVGPLTDHQSLVSFAGALKTKIQDSKFFPPHLRTIIADVLSTFQESNGDSSMLQLCSGLLLLHISCELGFVDISEHMTSTAEAIEAEVASMTWAMIAEDSCNGLVRLDEPLPVRPSQSERRQILGKYVKDQVIF